MKRLLGSPVLRSPLSIVPESRYWQDEGQPSSLLEETCREQFGRLHTLYLLNAYLASAAGGRRRQAVADEEKALRALYEAVWADLEFAFSNAVVMSARRAIEALLTEECCGPTQLELF